MKKVDKIVAPTSRYLDAHITQGPFTVLNVNYSQPMTNDPLSQYVRMK